MPPSIPLWLTPHSAHLRPTTGSSRRGRQLPDPRPRGRVQLETFVPWTLVKRSMKREMITPLDVPRGVPGGGRRRAANKASKDSALVRALGLAHYWSQVLDGGKAKTPADIARLEAMNIV
jgi:hypothetical protein